MLKSAQEKASVTIKRNGRGLLAKQGEYSGVKELLLRVMLKVTEWKERGTNERNEVTGGIGSLIGIC